MNVRKWPRVAAQLHDISLLAAVIPNAEPAPTGAAKINIILNLLDEVAAIPGCVAECGVHRGQTLIPLFVHLRSSGSPKRIFGFDSFEGFPAKDLADRTSKLPQVLIPKRQRPVVFVVNHNRGSDSPAEDIV
jgi:hypothetical protein